MSEYQELGRITKVLNRGELFGFVFDVSQLCHEGSVVPSEVRVVVRQDLASSELLSVGDVVAHDPSSPAAKLAFKTEVNLVLESPDSNYFKLRLLDPSPLGQAARLEVLVENRSEAASPVTVVLWGTRVGESEVAPADSSPSGDPGCREVARAARRVPPGPSSVALEFGRACPEGHLIVPGELRVEVALERLLDLVDVESIADLDPSCPSSKICAADLKTSRVLRESGTSYLKSSLAHLLPLSSLSSLEICVHNRSGEDVALTFVLAGKMVEKWSVKQDRIDESPRGLIGTIVDLVGKCRRWFADGVRAGAAAREWSGAVAREWRGQEVVPAPTILGSLRGLFSDVAELIRLPVARAAGELRGREPRDPPRETTLGFETGEAVEPGKSSKVEVPVVFPIRITRLLLDPGARFSLVDVRVGKDSAYLSGTPLGAGVVTQLVGGVPLAAEVAHPGTTVTIWLRNEGSSPSRTSGAIVGEVQILGSGRERW